MPKVEALVKISEETGAGIDWLIGGEGESEVTISDMTMIKHFDVQASAGDGSVIDQEDQLAPIAFSRAWLRATANVAPEQLSVITARGDSMLPRIRSGAQLLVNHSLSEFQGDSIYAFLLDGDLYVKHLQKRLGGGVVIISENPMYPPIDVPNLDAVNMSVIGEVVWHGDWI